MQSLEILKQELITQKKLLDEKGFPVDVKNVNPSPSEITKAIENITLDFSQSDAVESDVVAGKTFYSKNTELKTGTLELPDFEFATATENTVMAGKTFYAGNAILKTGTAKIPDLSQTTATADTVMQGKAFFNASGEKVTGTYKDMLQAIVDARDGDYSYLFYHYPKSSGLDIRNLNLDNAVNMYNMFAEGNLTNMDLSHCNIKNVQYVNYMFNNCSYITDINLSNWDTSNITTAAGMFDGCRELKNLNLSGWKPRNVTDMGRMFYDCSALKTVDLSEWDTSNVTNMRYLFNNCSSLTTILGTLDLIKCTSSNSTGNLFAYCKALSNVTVKNIKMSLSHHSGLSTDTGAMSMDSLTNAIKELWNNTDNALGGTRRLSIGSANLAKLADVYVKLIPITDEMRAEDEYIDNKAPFVQCESTDEGAMLITEYVTTVKNWTLA